MEGSLQIIGFSWMERRVHRRNKKYTLLIRFAYIPVLVQSWIPSHKVAFFTDNQAMIHARSRWGTCTEKLTWKLFIYVEQGKNLQEYVSLCEVKYGDTRFEFACARDSVRILSAWTFCVCTWFERETSLSPLCFSARCFIGRTWTPTQNS